VNSPGDIQEGKNRGRLRFLLDPFVLLPSLAAGAILGLVIGIAFGVVLGHPRHQTAASPDGQRTAVVSYRFDPTDGLRDGFKVFVRVDGPDGAGAAGLVATVPWDEEVDPGAFPVRWVSDHELEVGDKHGGFDDLIRLKVAPTGVVVTP
jgi:hypothetical protein